MILILQTLQAWSVLVARKFVVLLSVTKSAQCSRAPRSNQTKRKASLQLAVLQHLDSGRSAPATNGKPQSYQKPKLNNGRLAKLAAFQDHVSNYVDSA
ncbi:hypothetical protein O9992_01860 [Vibrio lentus]|nr:hypothetical protein [Vibrio lentus]